MNVVNERSWVAKPCSQNRPSEMSVFQTAFLFYAAVDVHAYDYAAQNPVCAPTLLLKKWHKGLKIAERRAIGIVFALRQSAAV